LGALAALWLASISKRPWSPALEELGCLKKNDVIMVESLSNFRSLRLYQTGEFHSSSRNKGCVIGDMIMTQILQV
jgi:hypothetical protein